MHSISIRDLTLRFGAHTVLQTMNLDVAEGEFVVLLGPSGCGKSTLLNCIAGFLDITDGQIWIKGKNVTWAEPSERGIGMVFQSYALYPQMTVRGNLSFGLKNARCQRPRSTRAWPGRRKSCRSSRCWTASPRAVGRAAAEGGDRARAGARRGRVSVRRALSNLDAKLAQRVCG